MSEYQAIEYKKDGRIAYITINRPNTMNALSAQVLEELNSAFTDFRDDDNVWVAVLTGAGERAFSAGADINDLSHGMLGSNACERIRADRIWKPVIAAIHGYCLGAGLELAMECDMRIAAENTRLGQPEINIGFMPGGGGTQRLPRFVPRAKAAEILLTGQQIDAQEAYRIGLVNKVVPKDKLMSTAKEWADTICRSGPLGVRATKEAMIRGYDLPLGEGLKLETELADKITKADDFKEGSRAFAEKRPPNYKAK